MKCPNCGLVFDEDNYGYTAINQDAHPWLMIYAPTCGECGHQIQDKSEWLFPVLPKGARILGGMMVYPLFCEYSDKEGA